MKRLLVVFIVSVGFITCTDNKRENKPSISHEVKMITSPASDSSSVPYLFTSKDETVYMSWVEKKGKESSLRFSILSNGQWSAPSLIASGNDWFVNWADYPVIAADGNKNLVAHFLEKSDTAKFTYDIKLVTSTDNGSTWSNASTLNDDEKKAEHGFVTIIPYKDGFFSCWLDGRKTAMEEDMSQHEGHHGEMTVRAAMLDKKGKKINEWELDGRVCDCCQTTAAITENGPVVVYRDRSDDEIRDMSITRLENGQWSKPISIYSDNWNINACPVNGPRADAINNNLAIAWFSMPDKKAEVKIIFSKDGGATFGKPIKIDEGNPIGRVDVVMLDTTTAIVSWMEGASIKAVKVHADGTKEASVMVASSSDKRSAGFPQMTRSGNKLFFAWTDDKEKSIKVSSLTF